MSVSVTHGSTTHLHLWRKTRICIHLVYQYHQREVFAGCATAPRLGMVGCVLPSPHSRLRRQCGVIYNVTARAVNIAGFQFFTLIRHLKHNRASGCNINNPALTASEAMPATWGKAGAPKIPQPWSGCRPSREGKFASSDMAMHQNLNNQINLCERITFLCIAIRPYTSKSPFR